MRFWRSNACGKVECMEPDADDYNAGDSEPCICGDLKCVATVEELEATVDDPRIHELLEHLVDDDEKGQGSHRPRTKPRPIEDKTPDEIATLDRISRPASDADRAFLRREEMPRRALQRFRTPRGARKPRDAD